MRAAEAALDRAPRAAALEALVALTHELAPVRMNVLDGSSTSHAEELERRREQVPLVAPGGARSPSGRSRPFAEALARPGISVIAEHKRRSPSAGAIRDGRVADGDRPGL